LSWNDDGPLYFKVKVTSASTAQRTYVGHDIKTVTARHGVVSDGLVLLT
jgi:hypothetical protein